MIKTYGVIFTVVYLVNNLIRVMLHSLVESDMCILSFSSDSRFLLSLSFSQHIVSTFVNLFYTGKYTRA